MTYIPSKKTITKRCSRLLEREREPPREKRRKKWKLKSISQLSPQTNPFSSLKQPSDLPSKHKIFSEILQQMIFPQPILIFHLENRSFLAPKNGEQHFLHREPHHSVIDHYDCFQSTVLELWSSRAAPERVYSALLAYQEEDPSRLYRPANRPCPHLHACFQVSSHLLLLISSCLWLGFNTNLLVRFRQIPSLLLNFDMNLLFN